MEEAHGAQHERELDELELDALGEPRGPVLGLDGDVTRPEVVVRHVVVRRLAAVLRDRLTEELLLPRPGPDGPVGERGRDLDLLTELRHDGPEALGRVGRARAGDGDGLGLRAGAEGAQEGEAGRAEVHGRQSAGVEGAVVRWQKMCEGE